MDFDSHRIRRGNVLMAKKGLVKHAGKVITAAHAAKCVGKGFKGCSNTEIAAIVKVIGRMASAAKRRK